MPHPAPRHNKVGFLEQKNGLIKTILRKISLDPSKCTLMNLVSRAIFLSNILSGNSILSSFQLVYVYQPAILGLSRSIYPENLLEAYKKLTTTRALQKILFSRNVISPPSTIFKEDEPIWVWYGSSKSNKQNEWVRAKVAKVHHHYLEVRRVSADGISALGFTVKPVYEDVRLASQGDLTDNILS